MTENAELIFTSQGQTVLACPHASGGKDWEAGAYSPLTNTMYMPLRNVCSQMRAMAEPDELDEARRLYAIAWRPEIAPGTDQVGSVQAISAETGQVVWNYQQRGRTMALAATGGGLVFGGDVNGRFRAFDHETGEILWEVNLGSPRFRLPRHLRGGRPSVRRGQHRLRPLSGVDSGTAPQHGEQPVRLRPA